MEFIQQFIMYEMHMCGKMVSSLCDMHESALFYNPYVHILCGSRLEKYIVIVDVTRPIEHKNNSIKTKYELLYKLWNCSCIMYIPCSDIYIIFIILRKIHPRVNIFNTSGLEKIKIVLVTKQLKYVFINF